METIKKDLPDVKFSFKVKLTKEARAMFDDMQAAYEARQKKVAESLRELVMNSVDEMVEQYGNTMTILELEKLCVKVAIEAWNKCYQFHKEHIERDINHQ